MLNETLCKVLCHNLVKVAIAGEGRAGCHGGCRAFPSSGWASAGRLPRIGHGIALEGSGFRTPARILFRGAWPHDLPK